MFKCYSLSAFVEALFIMILLAQTPTPKELSTFLGTFFARFIMPDTSLQS